MRANTPQFGAWPGDRKLFRRTLDTRNIRDLARRKKDPHADQANPGAPS